MILHSLPSPNMCTKSHQLSQTCDLRCLYWKDNRCQNHWLMLPWFVSWNGNQSFSGTKGIYQPYDTAFKGSVTFIAPSLLMSTTLVFWDSRKCRLKMVTLVSKERSASKTTLFASRHGVIFQTTWIFIKPQWEPKILHDTDNAVSMFHYNCAT